MHIAHCCAAVYNFKILSFKKRPKTVVWLNEDKKDKDTQRRVSSATSLFGQFSPSTDKTFVIRTMHFRLK